jgi:hypothetical protein
MALALGFAAVTGLVLGVFVGRDAGAILAVFLAELARRQAGRLADALAADDHNGGVVFVGLGVAVVVAAVADLGEAGRDEGDARNDADHGGRRAQRQTGCIGFQFA